MGNSIICCAKENSDDSESKSRTANNRGQSKLNGPSKDMIMSEDYYRGTGTFQQSRTQDMSFGDQSQLGMGQSIQDLRQLNKQSPQNQLTNPNFEPQDFSKSDDTVFYSFTQSRITSTSPMPSNSNFGKYAMELQAQEYDALNKEIQLNIVENNNENTNFKQDYIYDSSEQEISQTKKNAVNSVDNINKMRGTSVVIQDKDKEEINQNYPAGRSIEELKQDNIYTQQQLNYIQEAEDMIACYIKSVDLNNKDNGYSVYSQKGTMKCHININNGVFTCRCEDEIYVTDMQKVIKWLSDFDERYKNDEMFEKGIMLEQISDNINISRQQFKGMAIVQPRDFIILSGIIQKGQEFFLVAKSKELDDKYPQIKNVVRGILIIAGWQLVPVPDKENYYKTIYISKSNPQGKLPAYLMKGSSKFVMGMVKKVKTKCEKEFKNK